MDCIEKYATSIILTVLVFVFISMCIVVLVV